MIIVLCKPNGKIYCVRPKSFYVYPNEQLQSAQNQLFLSQRQIIPRKTKQTLSDEAVSVLNFLVFLILEAAVEEACNEGDAGADERAEEHCFHHALLL